MGYQGKIKVTNGGRIIAKGEPYLPIVFTSGNDDMNGAIWWHSSGHPHPGDYKGLVVGDGSQVEYCSFLYAGQAVRLENQGPIAIQHNRFYWVHQAVYVDDPCDISTGDTVNIFNNLMIADPCNCSAMIEIFGEDIQRMCGSAITRFAGV